MPVMCVYNIIEVDLSSSLQGQYYSVHCPGQGVESQGEGSCLRSHVNSRAKATFLQDAPFRGCWVKKGRYCAHKLFKASHLVAL